MSIDCLEYGNPGTPTDSYVINSLWPQSSRVALDSIGQPLALSSWLRDCWCDEGEIVVCYLIQPATTYLHIVSTYIDK